MADITATPSLVKPIPPAAKRDYSSLPFWLGLGASIAWIGVVGLIIARAGAAQSFGGVPLTTWAIGLSAVASPVALIWMLAAYMQRASDVQVASEPLRRQLNLILGEQGAAEARVRRFNNTVREQLELIRKSSELGQHEVGTMLQRLQDEKTAIQDLVERGFTNAGKAGELVRAAQQFDDTLSAKLKSLQELDHNLRTGHGEILKHTDNSRAALVELLRDISDSGTALQQSLRDATADGQKLRAVLADQYANLSEARSAVDDATDNLATRSKELRAIAADVWGQSEQATEALRRTVSALQETEAAARQQAEHSSTVLLQHGKQLRQMFEDFGTQLGDADENLTIKKADLETLVARVSTATLAMAKALDESGDRFAHVGESGLERAREATQTITAQAHELMAQLAAVGRDYEAVAERTGDRTRQQREQIDALSQQLGRYVMQLESIDQHATAGADHVGEQARGAIALAAEVQERLETLRTAFDTTSVAAHRQLTVQAEEQRGLIATLSDAAMVGASVLAKARESLVEQQDTLAVQTRDAEAQLRDVLLRLQDMTDGNSRQLRAQAQQLQEMLTSTHSRLTDTERLLADFAPRILTPIQQAVGQVDTATQQGLQSLENFAGGMNAQAQETARLLERMAQIDQQIDQSAQRGNGAVAQMLARLEQLGTAQDETLRAAHARFDALDTRLQQEGDALATRATNSVDQLQKAIDTMRAQGRDLGIQADQAAQIVTAALERLQRDGGTAQSDVQDQATALANDLQRMQQQFAATSTDVKERADAACLLLDRVSGKFNDVTSQLTTDVEAKTTAFQSTLARGQQDAIAFSGQLQERMQLLQQGSEQLHTLAATIASANSKIINQLQFIAEDSQRVSRTIQANIATDLAQLETANAELQRHGQTLAVTADGAVGNLQRTGQALADQAGKLTDLTTQQDQYLRQLATSMTSLHEQSSHLRTGIEQQGDRLLSGLQQNLAQMRTHSEALQQNVATALLGADQAATRFATLHETGLVALRQSSDQLQGMAGQTETALHNLQRATQTQLAGLNDIIAALAQQQQAVSATTAAQRDELTGLFDRLATAHNHATAAAERSAARLDEVAQQVGRLVGDFTNQTQQNLASVRTAGGGFGDQAQAIILNAQQAEQQVRAVMTVTASLAEHARQIRDKTQSDAQQLTDNLAQVLGQIDGGGERLRLLAQDAVATLDRSAQAFANSTAQTAQHFTEQTAQLDTTAVAATARLTHLANQLREHHQDLQQTGLASEQQTAQLITQATAMLGRLDALTTALASAEGQAQNATTTLGTHIATAAAQLRDSVTALSQTSDSIVQNASGTAQVIGERTARFVDLAEQLRHVGVQVPDAIDQAAQRLIRAEEALRASGDATLTQMAQRQLQTAEQAASLRTTADQANEALQNFGQQLSEQLRALQNGAGMLSAEEQKLLDHTAMALAQMGAASDRLSQLRDQADQAQNHLAQRWQQTGDAGRQWITQLESHVQTMGQHLAALGNSGTQTGVALQAASDRIRAQLMETQRLLADQMGALNATLGETAAQLGVKSSQIRGAIADALSDSDKLDDRFAALANHGAARVGAQVDVLRNMAEDAGTLLAGFAATLDQQLRHLDTAATALQRTQGELGGEIGRNLADVENLHAKLDALRQMTAGSGEQMALQLRQLGATLQTQLQQLANGTAQAVEVINDAGGNWQDQAHVIARIAQQARGELAAVAYAMDALQEKGEAMRVHLRAQGKDLIGSLSEMIDQLEETEQPQNSDDPMVNRIERGLQKIS